MKTTIYIIIIWLDVYNPSNKAANKISCPQLNFSEEPIGSFMCNGLPPICRERYLQWRVWIKACCQCWIQHLCTALTIVDKNQCRQKFRPQPRTKKTLMSYFKHRIEEIWTNPAFGMADFFLAPLWYWIPKSYVNDMWNTTILSCQGFSKHYRLYGDCSIWSSFKTPYQYPE